MEVLRWLMLPAERITTATALEKDVQPAATVISWLLVPNAAWKVIARKLSSREYLQRWWRRFQITAAPPLLLYAIIRHLIWSFQAKQMCSSMIILHNCSIINAIINKVNCCLQLVVAFVPWITFIEWCPASRHSCLRKLCLNGESVTIFRLLKKVIYSHVSVDEHK